MQVLASHSCDEQAMLRIVIRECLQSLGLGVYSVGTSCAACDAQSDIRHERACVRCHSPQFLEACTRKPVVDCSLSRVPTCLYIQGIAVQGYLGGQRNDHKPTLADRQNPIHVDARVCSCRFTCAQLNNQ